MTMPYSTQAEIYQWARESSPGVDLPATSKILTEGMTFTPQDTNYRPPLVRGLQSRNRGFETVVNRWTQWQMQHALNFEQFQHLLCMNVTNIAAPTGAGPYVWTATRNPALNDPLVNPFTLERRTSNGSTNIDHAVHYALGDYLKVSGDADGIVMVEARGFGRRMQTETITAALAYPSPNLVAANLVKVYDDASWGALGGTQIANQVLGFEHEFVSGLYPIATLDGRSDLDFTLYGVNADNVAINAKITMLVGADYVAKLAQAEANTLRAIRIDITDPTGKNLQIDFLAKYDKPNLREFGDNGDGQRTIVLALVDSPDGTNMIRYKLTNSIATLI